jgi:PAS domain S-box-containing protein
MKEHEYRILHLEDIPSDAVLAQREIRKVLINSSIRVVETEADFRDQLEIYIPHIVISDFKLPSFDGLSALKIVLEKSPFTPVIILTGSMNEDTAVDCMKAGATDYVIKGHIKRLGPAILTALEQREILIEKKKAEQSLLQSEENFRRSISESPLGIRIVSFDGKTVYANKAFLDIYEFSSLDELTSTPSKNRYTPESYAQHLERKERRKNGLDVYNYELSIVRKNEEIRHIKVSRKEVLWNGDKHYLVINQDITEQKKLTTDLITSKEKAEESERLKTAFLHNISHEIRTPMNAIVGFSGFLNDPDLLPEKRNHFIEIIVQNCNQLLSIISDIVSIAAIEAGQEKIAENEIELNSLLLMLQEQFLLKAKMQNTNIELSASFPENGVNIISDETKLVQVLNNLLGNALKFTKQGYINFGYIKKGNELEFFVEDTGIGIPAEMHKEIFERFRQVDSAMSRQFGGSGLGLSISKAYVELLGGKIWLNSESGHGSTFYFTIPYKTALEKKTLTKQSFLELEITKCKAKTLLVAEDEESNFLLMAEMLSGLNANIVRAVSGAEVVAICKSSQHIDLVLMDIKMPGMDGYEATKQLRKFMPFLPILAQTAYASDEDKKRAINCGCNDYISKPINRELLISKIEQLLNDR